MSTDAVKTVSVEIAGKEISFETGKMAKQASGSVVVRQGDTMVLCTATIGNLRDVDFLPLTVDVEERMYAAGKIPGSFFRREGRPSEDAILTCRLIDRSIRPLFAGGLRCETQIIATVPAAVAVFGPLRAAALSVTGFLAALLLFLAVFEAWTVIAPTVVVALLVCVSYFAPTGGPRSAEFLRTRPVSWWVMTWFIAVAITLTVVGTFFRGPGWSWVWPWR